jgi:hypothetical protein
MPAEPVSRPWRRFLRFSVRGMIVVVLVSGAGLVWVVRLVYTARIQREAVAAVQNAGGAVAYNWNRTDGEWRMGGEPWAPNWLVGLVGVDYFGRCTAVWLGQPSTATDPVIAHVARLTNLDELHFIGPAQGDAELADLTGLVGVRDLKQALPGLTIYH